MNKKKKMFLFIGIILLSLVVLISIFGLIDYFRAESGKKPIFSFHTINVTFFDVDVRNESVPKPYKEGTTYYGIGYNVSICDNETKEYLFNLGYKEKRTCHDTLACIQEKGNLVLNEDGTTSYDDNDKDSYEYSFFDGKLYLVTATLKRPIPKEEPLITNEEVAGFYNSIPGCVGYVSSQTQTSYEIIVSCNMNRMSDEDIDNYLLVRSKDLIGYTKEEIINYYHNDLDCK